MKPFFYPLICCLLSSSAFAQTETKFNPSQGDQRQYQVYSKTQVSIDAGSYTQTQVIKSHQLQSFKVMELVPNMRFEVHIDYMKILDDKGQGFSSTEAAERAADMHAIFSKGFEFSRNVEDGNVLGFSALNKSAWQSILKRKGIELEQEMKKLFGSSMFLTNIPHKVGSKVSLPNYQSNTDAVLTVLNVTEQTVLIKVESDKTENGTAMSRLYGHVLINREDGLYCCKLRNG